jgi:hypothetical protein
MAWLDEPNNQKTMSDKYILEGKKTVPCEDLMEWAKWFEQADRSVAKDDVNGVSVSTVFLGLDHAFGESQPMLFETMVFGGDLDQEQARYSTWDEAETGHKEMVARVCASSSSRYYTKQDSSISVVSRACF